MASRRSSSRLSLNNNNPVIEVGDRVTVISSGLQGVCRFSGSTDFAGGNWIGVELDEASGKNDGSVGGIKYFDSADGHGIFMRAAQLQLENAVHRSLRTGLSPGTLSRSVSLSPDSTATAASTSKSTKIPSPELVLKPLASSRAGKIPITSSKSASTKESTSAQQSKPISKTKPVSPRMTRSRAKVGRTDTPAASEQPAPSKWRGKAAASAVADPVDIIAGKIAEEKEPVIQAVKRRPPSRIAANRVASIDDSKSSFEHSFEQVLLIANKPDTQLSHIHEEKKMAARNVREKDDKNQPRSPEIISTHLMLTGMKSPTVPQSPPEVNSSTSPSVILQQSATEKSVAKSPKEKDPDQSRRPLKDIESLQYSSTENVLRPSGLPTPSKFATPVGLNTLSAQVSTSPNPLLYVSARYDESKSPVLLKNETKLEFLQISAADLGNETFPEEVSDEKPAARVGKPDKHAGFDEELASKYEAKLVVFEKEKQSLLVMNENLLFNQKQLETRLNASLEKIRLQDQEVDDLKVALADRTHNEALKDTLNILQTRFEAVKLDADNARLHAQKLQSEMGPLKKKIHTLQEALDNRNDAFEMAIVDKCVAEENLEILKNEIKILKSHVEELSLELELGSAKEPTAVQAITDSHELAIMNERLTTALIKLRDMATQKEADLTEKLAVRDQDLTRLKDIEALHSDMTEKLERATEKIQILQTQVDDVHESAALISNLTEANLELDETLVQKKLETLELERLRKLNNELEDAHIALESQLYRDLDLKELIIRELTVRFNQQTAALSSNIELVSKLRAEIDSCNAKLEDQSKHADLEASHAIIMQKLRLSESTVETLENSLQVYRLHRDIAAENLDMSTGLLSKLSSHFDERRFKSYSSCKSLCRKVSLLIDFAQNRAAFDFAPVFFEMLSITSLLQIPFMSNETSFSNLESLYSLMDAEDMNSRLDQLLARFIDGIYDTSSEAIQIEWFTKQGKECLIELGKDYSESQVPATLAGPGVLDNILQGVAFVSSLVRLVETVLSFNESALDSGEAAIELLILLKALTAEIEKTRSFTEGAREKLHLKGYYRSTYEQLIVLQIDANKSLMETVNTLGQLLKGLHQPQTSASLLKKDLLACSSAIASWEIMTSKVREGFSKFEPFKSAQPLRLEPSWSENCNSIHIELAKLPIMQEKLTELQTSLNEQVELAKKQKEISEALQAKNLLISKKNHQTETIKLELEALQSRYSSALASKEEYQNALEAMHNDLKDAEAEIEQLKEASERTPKSIRSSPVKRKSIGHSKGSDVFTSAPPSNLANSAIADESQMASVRFLLMENSRLRSNEYSRSAFELFHPSDPVMKRIARKDAREDAEIEGVIKDKTEELKRLKNNAFTLRREFEHFLSTVKVVDLTNTPNGENEPHQIHKTLNPVNQWTFQRRYLLDLVNRSTKVVGDAPDSIANQSSQTVTIGRLHVGASGKETSSQLDSSLLMHRVTFASHLEMKEAHESILSF